MRSIFPIKDFTQGIALVTLAKCYSIDEMIRAGQSSDQVFHDTLLILGDLIEELKYIARLTEDSQEDGLSTADDEAPWE